LDRLGVDSFYSAVHVEVKRIPFRGIDMQRGGGSMEFVPLMKDKDYAILANLRHVRSLSVRGAPLGDLALAHIGQAKSLERVSLTVMGGLERDAPYEQRTQIVEGGISDAGLGHLANLRQLTYLSINTGYYPTSGRPVITDEGLAHLARLTKLEELLLTRTGITGPGLRYLKKLRNLKVVTIDTATLGAEAFEHLVACSQLRELRLFQTRNNDAVLLQLAKMTSLQTLSIEGEQLTDDGVRKLMRELPNCKVQYRFTDPQPAGPSAAQNP
jgi:hypothetical protein